MDWLDRLRFYLRDQNDYMVSDSIESSVYLNEKESDAFQRKKEQLSQRNAEIVNAKLKAKILRCQQVEDRRVVEYLVHRAYLIKQKNHFYVEEALDERKVTMINDELTEDDLIYRDGGRKQTQQTNLDRDPEPKTKDIPTYRRLEAVKYAERWWNSYNPAYRSFENDCTNYISQCLHAGGAPMRGYPNRSKGWWCQNNNWSYSWTVANALRWYLSGSKQGLRGEEMNSADQLRPGDVICYDFDGDGHWQHTTMVVAKDKDGMPLVNAHTTNSRMRYWDYQDSTAWTPEIQYKFFHIVDA
jgi:hypothetical protein